MKAMKIILIAVSLMLSSCGSNADIESEPLNYSRPEQSPKPDFDAPKAVSTDEYTPLNYENQIGKWFPYMDYAEYMSGKSEDEFRDAVIQRFSEAKSQNINTVYVHTRACGDAYYNSEIFPNGVYLDGDYDALEIMTEEAHKLELSVHAWINPLRCMTVQQTENLPDDCILKEWADTVFMSIVGERYYLNPAYDEVRELICRGAEEILSKYDVDGLHIDDYFYPTTDTDFDCNIYNPQTCGELSQWRLDNCTKMVSELYDTVKSFGEERVFGISPQGNIQANYDSQYADVKKWCGNAGFCDYIVPQIYFGFRNESCPFEETVRKWENLTCDEVSLIIGLAEYKQGEQDKWAGISGENEWIEDNDIISRQIQFTEKSSADGYALYG